MDEELLIVDSYNKVRGEIGKIKAHQWPGTRHRAFTAVVKNEEGKWLITKRSGKKPLWPNWWDLAVSSHPWLSEQTDTGLAVRRRVPFEIGAQVGQVRLLGTYEYAAVYNSEWAEHEYNEIWLAELTGEIQLNEDEVADYRWATLAEIKDEVVPFAPWVRYAIPLLI